MKRLRSFNFDSLQPDEGASNCSGPPRFGPLDVDELFDWESRIVCDLVASDGGDEKMDRVWRNLNQDINIDSVCSGMLTEVSALSALIGYLKDQDHSAVRGKLTVQSACDYSPLACRVMSALPAALKPRHLFSDYCERIPKKVLADLCNAESVIEKRLAQLDFKNVKEMHLKGGQMKLEEFAKILSQLDFKVTNRSWCMLDKQMCNCKACVCNGLQLVVAGKNYSPMGPQSAADGDDFKMVLVFIFERRAYKEDIILLENVPASLHTLLPVLDRFLGHLYTIEFLIASPNQFGWPMSRRRAFLLLRNRQTVDCALPFNSSLLEGFKRSTMMCGNDLFMAPTDYLAERPATGPLQKLLKLGDVERLEYQKSTVKDKDKLKKKAQPNLVIPSLLCASKLASLKPNRLLMGREHLSAMGWHVWPGVASQAPKQLCPFVDVLGEFTETQLKSLSMETRVLRIFFVFICRQF